MFYTYTMGIRKDDKLNRLLKAVPEGVVVPSTWLTRNGYTPQLVHKYVRSGWLLALANRAYARPGVPINWEGVLLGLQRLGGYKLHLGGASALGRQGMAHYLPLGGDFTVHVWGRAKPPAWLNTLALETHWAFHRRQLFAADIDESWVELPTGIRDWTLRASAPERAVLEVLSTVDETAASFTFAAELFAGLTTAKPQVVTALLKACTHSKAKRLFLFLAEHYHYSWWKRVELAGVDLGKGKRLVTRGGRFDKRYQITVPETFHN